jgi:hypothetical protein
LTSTSPGDWHTVEDWAADWHDSFNWGELDWFAPTASRGAAAIVAAAVATPTSVAQYFVVIDHFLTEIHFDDSLSIGTDSTQPCLAKIIDVDRPNGGIPSCGFSARDSAIRVGSEDAADLGVALPRLSTNPVRRSASRLLWWVY